MPSSKRKTATSTKKSNCYDCFGAGATLSALIMIVGYVLFQLFDGPKYEVGDCLLNRVGQTVKVTHVYEGLEEYTVQQQKYVENVFGWVAISDYEKSSADKDMDFVNENYVEIPCSR